MNRMSLLYLSHLIMKCGLNPKLTVCQTRFLCKRNGSTFLSPVNHSRLLLDSLNYTGSNSEKMICWKSDVPFRPLLPSLRTSSKKLFDIRVTMWLFVFSSATKRLSKKWQAGTSELKSLHFTMEARKEFIVGKYLLLSMRVSHSRGTQNFHSAEYCFYKCSNVRL